MQIINLLSWQPGYSGFGSYVRRVVPYLSGRRLQLDHFGRATVIKEDQWVAEPPPLPPSALPRILHRYSLVQHGINMHKLLERHKLSLQEISAIYSPFFDTLLAFPDLPQVITCHDLTPLIYPNSLKAWLRYRYWQPYHIATAKKIISISRHVADHLLRFGVPCHKIEIVSNGIAIRWCPITSPQSEDLVAVARHDGNKNIPYLLRAIADLQKRRPQWNGCLRIVGRRGKQTKLIRRIHRDLPRPSQVKLTDSLSSDDMTVILRSSLALVSASLEEGFDYPVLEAKSHGVPTVISHIPVHLEFHACSSLFFSMNDEGRSLTDQLVCLLDDYRLWSDLSEGGFSLAKQMTVKHQVVQVQGLIDSLG